MTLSHLHSMFSSNNHPQKTIQTELGNATVYPLNDHPGYSIQITDKVGTIAELWDQVSKKDNLFLQSSYLKMLEQFPPDKMTFRYLVFYHNNTPIGVSYNQVFRLSIEDSMQQNETSEPKQSFCILTAIKKAVKNWFIKKAEFNLLICGNMLLTGAYGYSFNDQIDASTAAALIQDSLESLQTVLDTESIKINIHLIKDHLKQSNDTLELKKTLQKDTYHPFLMQPSMHMPIRENWIDFDAYLSDMSSKYRVRAKRARKKGKDIVKKELSLEEIEANEDRIHALYKMIADGAGFNAFLLHKKYFTELKRSLGDQYKLTAYYIDGQLIAFYTAIFNYDEMDAHFLGVDSAFNRQHQVYLNILYDLVNRAIEGGAKQIDFARTALEIKSSVGAQAQEMLCFFKHRNALSSKFLQLVFDSLNPEEEWQPRSPFKIKEAPLSLG